MLAVVRLKSSIGTEKHVKKTLDILKLNRINTLVIVPDQSKGMIKKVDDVVAWGEVSDGFLKKIGSKKHLKAPRKGLKSLKKKFPKGSLGYHGKDIEKLIERMVE